MANCYLGFDTSCYTTSVACFSSEGVIFDGRKLLDIPIGNRGLRQSEGLYQHIKQIPELTEQLFNHISPYEIKGIGCSFSPTAAADSYMPVFLAGINTARCIASALQVPLYHLNHQIGHVRASIIGNDELSNARSFYSFHLSGGTTDLLRVNRMHNGNITVERIGCSNDLHAGQLVDRVGVSLGCPFPAGPCLEKMALNAINQNVKVPSSVKGLSCSLSGPETCFQRMIGRLPENEIAFGVYDLLARTVSKMFHAAIKEYGTLPVLMCGGVSSSDLFRSLLSCKIPESIYWGENKYSSDNAVGISAIAYDLGEFQY